MQETNWAWRAIVEVYGHVMIESQQSEWKSGASPIHEQHATSLLRNLS
jgi:hypothetical protein